MQLGLNQANLAQLHFRKERESERAGEHLHDGSGNSGILCGLTKGEARDDPGR